MKKALARLRWKTDRELCTLAEKQLEHTLQLAEEGRHEEAVRSYDAVLRILAVTNLSEADRVRLHHQLVAVRSMIEQPARAVA